MKSLFVVGLPRSLTTVCYHLAKDALGLREPAWVTDGEVLNVERFLFAPTHGVERFFAHTESPEVLNSAAAYLDTVVRPDGYAYKDVVQPFVATAYLKENPLQVVHIRRPVADVAFHMHRRGWFAFDSELLAKLVQGQKALAGISGAHHLEFEDIIFDESVLSEVLGAEVSYLSDEFRRGRDAVLALRKTDEYAQFQERFAQLLPTPTTSRPKPTDSSNKTRPVVMLVSDAQAPTGFARVGYEIAKSLSTDFEVHQVGINYHGEDHDLPWALYPAQIDSEPLEDRVGSVADLVQPDLVFLLNDPWVVARSAQRLHENHFKGKILGYCPVDGAPLLTECGEGLEKLDLLAAYTEFGRRAFVDLFATSKLNRPILAVVPHGVDAEVFDLLVPGQVAKSRKAAKARVFPAESKFIDSFVVLNANRNQRRKRIDITVRAFADFARDKPENVFLYLHMGKVDLGWDVTALTERYGITDRLIMSTASDQMPELTESELNLMYNACEVGLNTSSAEGWGLVSFEHAATGAAQVIPAIETQVELWEGVAELVPPAITMTETGQIADWHLVSADDVSAALERLYGDPDLLASRSESCFRHARRTELSWKEIGKSWTAHVEGVLQA